MRFERIELLTHVLAAQRAFYHEQLGLDLLDAGLQSFTVRAGTTELTFTETVGREPAYHFAFNVPENQIEQALRWVRERAPLLPHHESGAELIDWPYWNAHSVYFLDPAGNILEVIARHALANGSDAAFGPASLLNISEIGLAVSHAHTTVQLLADVFSLETRSLLPDFGAIGDDHALFIISDIGRAWMPTDDRTAQPYPARIVVGHQRTVDLLVPGTDYRIVSRGQPEREW